MGKLGVLSKSHPQNAGIRIQSTGATPWPPRLTGDTTSDETCPWSTLHASRPLRWPPGLCRSQCRARESLAVGPSAVARSALSVKPGCLTLTVDALVTFPVEDRGTKACAGAPRRWSRRFPSGLASSHSTPPNPRKSGPPSSPRGLLITPYRFP